MMSHPPQKLKEFLASFVAANPEIDEWVRHAFVREGEETRLEEMEEAA